MFSLSDLRRETATGILSVLLAASMAVPFVPAAFAATTPPLGAAVTYVILASTYTNTTAGTLVTGDVGFTTGPAVAPAGVHANYGSGAPYASAGTAQSTALSALASQPCTFTFAPGAINLSTDTTHGPAGIYTPGVYCSAGAMNVGGPLTLNGSGTYIFRPNGALTSTAGAVVTLSGTSACNVFWTPTQATTLAANTTFAGIVIADAGITVGANTAWNGMAFAFGGTVTTDTLTMAIPSCAAPPISSVVSSVSSSSSVSSAVSSSSVSSSAVSSTSSSQASSSSVADNNNGGGSGGHRGSRLPPAAFGGVRSSSSSVASSVSSSASSRRVVVLRVLRHAPLPPAPTPQVPLLPNTGVGPGATRMSWPLIAFVSFIATLSFLLASSQARRLASSGK